MCWVDRRRRRRRKLYVTEDDAEMNDYADGETIYGDLKITITNIKRFFKGTGYFIVCDGSTLFQGVIKFLANECNIALLDCNPVHHKKLADFKPEDKVRMFIERCKHMLKYSHVENTVILTDLSNEAVIDVDDLQ